MIQPTVGRVVLFYPGIARQQQGSMMAVFGQQPMAATVAFVYNEREVNLSVTDHAGKQWPAVGVRLLQDNDVLSTDIQHCTWMPYQKGQAAKTEELEGKLSTGGDQASYAADRGNG